MADRRPYEWSERETRDVAFRRLSYGEAGRAADASAVLTADAAIAAATGCEASACDHGGQMGPASVSVSVTVLAASKINGPVSRLNA